MGYTGLPHFETGMFVLLIKTLFAEQSWFSVTEHVANNIDYSLTHKVSASSYKTSPWRNVKPSHESLPMNIRD